MMRLPKHDPGPNRINGRHIMEGFKYVAGHRRVRILLLLFGVVASLAGRMQCCCLLCKRHSLSAKLAMVFCSVPTDSGHFGALTVAPMETRPATADDSRRTLVVLSHAGVVGHRALVSAGASVPGGWRLGNDLYFSTTNTLIQGSVSNAMRGRVMASGHWCSAA